MRAFLAALLALAVLASPALAGLEDGRAAIRAGDGVAAVRALEPLADKGDPAATLLLAKVFRDGLGSIAADRIRAMQLFRKAAERGDFEAQAELGRAHAQGNGVSRSAFQAYYWLGLAAANAPAARRAALEAEHKAAGRELTEPETRQADEMVAALLGRPTPSPPPPPSSPSPPTAAPQPRKPVALLPEQQAAPESRQARTTRSAGSGFVVAADGKVVTNAHVVPNCTAIRVTFADGVKRPATLVATDRRDDLALLAVEAADLPVARFRGEPALRSGDDVVVVGFPLSSVLSAEANVTVGVVSALAGMKGDARFLQITAPVQKGNSGGPLADMDGNVAGMVSKKLDAMKIADRTGDLPQNVNFALKTQRVLAFLSTNGLETVPGTQPASPLSAADVGERIKQVTVFVECDRKP